MSRVWITTSTSRTSLTSLWLHLAPMRVVERQDPNKEAPKPGAWRLHRAARSAGGSHSVRITNVHHDRFRPEVAVA